VPEVSPLRIMLTLPYLHRFETDNLPKLTAALVGAGWYPWFARFDADALATALDHSFSFVPQVRKLLFPEHCAAPAAVVVSADAATGARWGDWAVDSFRRRFTSDDADFAEAAVRLTWMAPTPWLGSRLRARGSGLPSEVGFSIDWADTLLLPQGVGVLLLRISVHEQLTVEEAANFVRLIKKRVFRRRLSVGLPQVVHRDGSEHHLGEFIELLVKHVQQNDLEGRSLEVAETFGTNFRYIALGATEQGPGGPSFDDFLEQTAFALATGHPGTSSYDSFSPRGLDELRAHNCIHSWDDWRVIAYDGSMAFAMRSETDQLQASAETVWDTVEWSHAVCLALLTAQEVRLHLLAGRAESTPTELAPAVAHLEDVEREFVRFRRLLWHEEITTTPVGAEVHRLLRRVMRLTEMSEFVQEEISIVKGRVDNERKAADARTTSRTADLVTVLTVVGVPVGLTLTFGQPLYNAALSDLLGGRAGWAVLLLALQAFVLLVVAAVITRRRR